MSALLFGLLGAAPCSSPAVMPIGGVSIVVERHPVDPVLVRPQGSSLRYAKLTGAVLVELKESTSSVTVNRLQATLNLVHVRNLPIDRFVLFRTLDACAAPTAALQLLAQPEVADATVEWLLRD